MRKAVGTSIAITTFFYITIGVFGCAPGAPASSCDWLARGEAAWLAAEQRMRWRSQGRCVARRRYSAFGNNNPGTPGNLLSGGGFTDP